MRLTYTNATLFPALAIARLIQRRRGSGASSEAGAEISVPPAPVNAIMTDGDASRRRSGCARSTRPSAVRCCVWLGSRPARRPDFRLEDPQSQVTTVGAAPPACARPVKIALVGLEHDRRRIERSWIGRSIEKSAVQHPRRGRCCAARRESSASSRGKIRQRRFALQMQQWTAGYCRRSGRKELRTACRDDRSSPRSAQPPPATSGARVELLLAPAVAETDQIGRVVDASNCSIATREPGACVVNRSPAS